MPLVEGPVCNVLHGDTWRCFEVMGRFVWRVLTAVNMWIVGALFIDETLRLFELDES